MFTFGRYAVLGAVVLALIMAASTILVLNAVTCGNVSYGNKSTVYVEAYISSDGSDGYALTDVEKKTDNKQQYFLKVYFKASVNRKEFFDIVIILDPATSQIGLLVDKPAGKHFSISSYAQTWWAIKVSGRWHYDTAAGVRALRNGFCMYGTYDFFIS